MTFAEKVKAELLSLENQNECCVFAKVYGMMMFGHSFSLREISIQTEKLSFAQYYCTLVEKVTGIKPEMVQSAGGTCTASIKTSEDRQKIMQMFNYTGREPTLRINSDNMKEQCCVMSFIGGAFLSCGTISSPEKDYHMEFSVMYRNLSNDFVEVFSELGMNAKIILRKGYNIIYFKESETIEDILTLMNATGSTLELMNVKIYKDFRNKANRITNCETANITKTVMAAVEQIQAIEKIKKANKFDDLTKELQEIATLRVENPDMSLRELGESLSVPISRSGVNHRMKKLIKISTEFLEEDATTLQV